MAQKLDFIIDGERETPQRFSPTTTLLNFLRERLSKTGTKEGCAEGDCGACTVVVVDLFEGEVRYRSMNSCIQFLPTLNGKIVFTVESLKPRGGSLHPAQQAMVECHGSQCGFCTPGFVMSLFALFKTNANPSRLEISDALSGNLCRCTGYRPILDAGQKMYDYELDSSVPGSHYALGSEGFQAFEAQLKAALIDLQQDTTTADFLSTHVTAKEQQFYAPKTLKELSQLTVDHPDAVILAGGTDIGLWVTKQQRVLEKVIYLGEVEELNKVDTTNKTITIGAAVNLETAFQSLVSHYPELTDLYKRFASLPIRNAGTLVGNLANGSPIGDAAPALIVLNASLILRKGEQVREIPLDEFYLDYMQKDLAAGEFVEAVRVPLLPSARALRVYKISKRFEQDISAVCGAFYARIEGGIIENIRICFGGMAATTKRANKCEQALQGQPWSMQSIDLAVDSLQQDYQPLSDMRASSNYRSAVAANLLRKFYLECASESKRIDVRAV